MFGIIARFELRYQLRNPVFWVATILFFLLTSGATTVESIRLGSGGNIHTNAPTAVAQIQLIMSLFFMFVTTAFVGNVVRDDETGFGGIIRSTKIGKLPYMFGRFSGALLGAAVAFLAVPLAIWIGTFMPWVDPKHLGPNRLQDYTAHPGDLGFGRENVVSMRRLPVRSGEQQVRIVTKRKPIYAAIDPYLSFINRDTNDNVVKVTDAGQ